MAPLRRIISQVTRMARHEVGDSVANKLARNKQFQQFAVRTNDAFERARREVEENGEEHVRRLAEMTHEKGVQPLRGFFRALRDEIKGVPPPRPPRR